MLFCFQSDIDTLVMQQRDEIEKEFTDKLDSARDRIGNEVRNYSKHSPIRVQL